MSINKVNTFCHDFVKQIHLRKYFFNKRAQRRRRSKVTVEPIIKNPRGII